MKINEVLTQRVHTSHAREVIIDALDRVQMRLVAQGILKKINPFDYDYEKRSYLQIPRLVQQFMDTDDGKVYMEDTEQNRKILDWFINKEDVLLKLDQLDVGINRKDYRSTKMTNTK